MEIIRTKTELRQYLKTIQTKSVGFVPTMGFLHDGHLSLIREAKNENDVVVVSIFVNPLQFGPEEDFTSYPRNEAQDMEAAQLAGVDLLFMPTVHEMYPEEMGIDMKIVKGTDVLCGQSRPGHFDGVATVLTKLFHLVQPDKTYFGLKDAQQFAIVHTLIQQHDFPIELVGLPTVRELDGLAKSSRNVYLSAAERTEAAFIYEGLQLGQQFIQSGERNVQSVIGEVTTFLLEKAPHAEIDYVSIYAYPELRPLQRLEGQLIVAVALQFERARLIDNIVLAPDGSQINRL